MRKNKARYNPFDDFLFWLDLAAIDFSFGLNNNASNAEHIEKPIPLKPPEEYKEELLKKRAALLFIP
jgi:hypothetical protein